MAEGKMRAMLQNAFADSGFTEQRAREITEQVCDKRYQTVGQALDRRELRLTDFRENRGFFGGYVQPWKIHSDQYVTIQDLIDIGVVVRRR